MKRIGLGLAAALALAGCDPGKDGALVDQGVQTFHQELDAGQYEQMFDQSAPEYQNAKPKNFSLKLFDAIHRKLGVLKTSTKTGWRDNMVNGGHFYIAAYNSTFTNGSAVETFTYRVKDGRAQLMGYNINSDALITN